ncbi:hypothetical protein Tco_1021272 [Tanacetum coccineum]
MRITSLPLFNQEDYSYFGTIFQQHDSHSDNALNNRRKLDDQESLNEIFDLLDDEKIPSSRYEVPSSGFENQALEMESLGRREWWRRTFEVLGEREAERVVEVS